MNPHGKTGEPLTAQVIRQVEIHGLLNQVDRLGLAVSGGADSMALLHLMAALCRQRGITALVLHFDHAWRAEESAQDAEFVRSQAAAMGLESRSARASSKPRRPGFSPEMAAREARLEFFHDCCVRNRLSAIATGHQADDVAELLLLRLARGAGAAGLAGLRPESIIAMPQGKLRLIRPLLTIRREALRNWLRQQGHAWREDGSNRDTRIARNALRLEHLPGLNQALGRNFMDGALKSVEILQTEDHLLSQMADEWLRQHRTGGALPRGALQSLHPAMQRRVLRAWLLECGDTPSTSGFAVVISLAKRLKDPTPWQMTLPAGRLLRCDQDLLKWVPAVRDAFQVSVAVPVPGSCRLEAIGIEAHTWLAPGIVREAGPIGRLPARCSLNPAALDQKRLVLRTRLPGDKIAPLGMRGSRKLQDILVDAKISRDQRNNLPLLACGDELAWIPGYRVARPFAVRHPERTALQVEFTAIED